jgi:hypothetical protein
MPMNKNTSKEIQVIESAHPYAMLDNDLPTMMSLVYQMLAKEGVTPQKPLFVIYPDDDEEKPKGKRLPRKKKK